MNMMTSVNPTGFLEEYFQKIFNQRCYFAIVYGSFVCGRAKKDSDLDFCVVAEYFTEAELKALKRFVLKFHRQNNLKIDNEVPFENKLISSYSEAEDAVFLTGFVLKEKRITIPPIRKNRKFLKSREIRLRLLVNALTTPHIILGNDLETYERLKDLSEKNMFLLATFLGKSPLRNTVRVLHRLLFGPNKEEGEMYLGYKNYPQIKKYMKAWIKKHQLLIPMLERRSEWSNLLKEVRKRSVSKCKIYDFI